MCPRVYGVALLLGISLSGAAGAEDLLSPAKREIAMQLVSSAENSSRDWRKQYAYIEDIDDGRGYTAGLIGFTSANGDMLDVVERYTSFAPSNRLAEYLPALRRLAENNDDSHEGLEPDFIQNWKAAARDEKFRAAQDRISLSPSLRWRTNDEDFVIER